MDPSALSQLSPEQLKAVMGQAQQEANQQIMQQMMEKMTESCFKKCAGTSVRVQCMVCSVRSSCHVDYESIVGECTNESKLSLVGLFFA